MHICEHVLRVAFLSSRFGLSVTLIFRDVSHIKDVYATNSHIRAHYHIAWRIYLEVTWSLHACIGCTNYCSACLFFCMLVVCQIYVTCLFLYGSIIYVEKNLYLSSIEEIVAC